MSNLTLRLLAAGLSCFAASAQGAMLDSLRDAGIVAEIVRQMDEPLARSVSPLRVSLAANGTFTVEMGSGFLADTPGPQIPAELDARLQAIRLAVLLQQEQTGALQQALEFRFNGHRVEDHFPLDAPRRLCGPLPAPGEGVDVFVSASHGWYLHGGSSWRLQRPLSNGMVEDLVTPQFARRLVDALGHDGVSSMLSRSEALSPHAVAGKPWWQMAARYHAQALYPARPDIWQSYVDRGTPLREYNDDIRSRPLMANQVGAGVLVHLHTNAAASSAARGAMVFVQPGRPEDQRLAHGLLCAMRDAIHRIPQYSTYAVRVQPHEGNYGENRLANAPSILIELGFHTNPNDAAALQDPQFQQAVAEGLRDGYRGFREGRGADGAIICR